MLRQQGLNWRTGGFMARAMPQNVPEVRPRAAALRATLVISHARLRLFMRGPHPARLDGADE
eukprot:1321338-Alexandrium_andersonii.AAC.1